MSQLLDVVVLISGRGSNLQSIIDQTQAGTLPIRIRAVISNCTDAYGLQRARTAGIATRVLDHRRFEGRAAYDEALMQLIDEYRPHLVVLAGFMRILGKTFVDHYAGRLINIHPSLLPEFPGLDTHARAIAAGATRHGATVHFVVPEVDAGPLIIQAAVPVCGGDTPAGDPLVCRRSLENTRRTRAARRRTTSQTRPTVRSFTSPVRRC
jgi:phosphoribosylglycinamide formyltransferase-1